MYMLALFYNHDIMNHFPLMVKLLLGSQGMLPLPVPAKVVVVVSGKKCKEKGNHSFHLLLTHLHETRDTEEKN